MEKYLFILGRNWRLALAEIDTYLQLPNYKGRITDYSANTAIVQFDKDIETDQLEILMGRLGSVLKIGKMRGFIERDVFEEAFPSYIPENRGPLLRGRNIIEHILTDVYFDIFPKIKNEKLFVAHSIYPEAFEDQYYHVLVRYFLQFVNKYYNTQLKKFGARQTIYYKYPQHNIESGTLNPIFPHHFQKYELYKPNRKEVLFCLTEEGMYIGETLMVTDPTFHRELDEQRPFKDFKQSMPPKFAKTLLSFLALVEPLEDKRILDPFCGSGTILQFAYALGFDIYGTDQSSEQIEGTKVNLKFVANYLSVSLSNDYLNSHIIQCEISHLDEKFKKFFFDGMATEPVLLPFYRKDPNEEDVLQKFQDEIQPIYEELLKKAWILLKPGARLAVVAPLVRTKRKRHLSMPIQSIGEKIGFKSLKLLNPTHFPQLRRRSFRIKSFSSNAIFDFGTERVSREFYLFVKPHN